MTTLMAGSALEFAQVVSDRLPKGVSQTARSLYKTLVEVGARVEEARGHSPSVSETVFHLPLELVCDFIGISRWTAWRHLPQLKALGVVDYRAHKASCRGETRNSGTVWRVRLSPLRGARTRVSTDDLRQRWRGHEMRGAASYKLLHHTKQIQDISVKLEILIGWAVNPKTYTNPVSIPSVCSNGPQASLEALLDVLNTPNQRAKVEAVDLGARALASALSDQTGLNFYRLLLWNLLRHYTVVGEDFTRVVYLTAVRARVDVQEGFAKRGGALFTARLKAAPWWSSVMGRPTSMSDHMTA